MSFAVPAVLIALVAIPLLVWWYVGYQSRRARAAGAFVQPHMVESVAPRRPGWRRHAPMAAVALALAVLIIAAARPQTSVAVPVTDGAVMLATDVSSSMRATDVVPSRLLAAQHAARRFLASLPSGVQVGALEFARTPTVLQSPTTNHALAGAALGRLANTSGGTAVGEAIMVALNELQSVPQVAGKRPPGAIVLISDGASNVGISPLTAARQAAAHHVPIDTISVGTPHGTIPITRGSQTVTTPVPVSRQQLVQIAAVARGRAFSVSDAAGLDAVYRRLALQLGHKHVKREVTASFAGAGLVLLLVSAAMSLRWFGRLI
jgi:Ca-activated chloride channel family protein